MENKLPKKQTQIYNKYFKKNEPITFEPQFLLPKKYQPPIILSGHTPQARFKTYRKEREDAYHSYDIIIDNIPPGNGGISHWNKIITDYKLNNIFLSNNHYLQYETIRDINNGKLKTHEDLEVIGLYGMTYIIPEFMQIELGLPACFCDLYYTDPVLFALKQKRYTPSNWCKELCPHVDTCSHKLLFSDAWETARTSVFGVQEAVLWAPPKAYNSSSIQLKGTKKMQNMINRILTTFDK